MNSSSREKYNTFCTQVEDTPIFFFPWFLDGVAIDGEWDVVLVTDQEKILAAMPYFVKQRFGLRYITMPLFTKYMGPLIHPDHRKLHQAHRLCEQLLQQLPAMAGMEQQFAPSVKSWLPFHWNGFLQTTQYTYRIDLQGDWQASINRNMRRNIRKADNVLKLRDDLGLAIFYRVNALSFERQGTNIPYSFAQLQKHDQALEKADARKLFFAVDENENIHSAAYLIWDKNCAYYHLSGDDPNLRDSGSGIWILNQAIQYSQTVLHKQFFDFEGSMLQPVEAIRRQFGAEQTPYHRIWKTDSVIYAFLKWLKRK